jgi:hypothetical protein
MVKLTLRSKLLFEKFTAVQLVMKFPARGPKVRYFVQNIPSLDSVLSHMNPVQILTSYFFKMLT